MRGFKPHSVRASSTSATALAKVLLDTILRTAGWSRHCTFLFMRYWQFTIAVIPCNSQTSRILATTCSSTSNFKPSLSRLSDEAEIHKMPLGKKSSPTCDYLAKMRGQLRELGHLLWRPSNLAHRSKSNDSNFGRLLSLSLPFNPKGEIRVTPVKQQFISLRRSTESFRTVIDC